MSNKIDLILKIIGLIKCLFGYHDFVGESIYQDVNPKFETISIEQKCSRCPARKTTFKNKNTGEVYKSFVI